MIVLFDDNNITIDGNTDLSVSEDHLQKFAAMKFNTESIDGYDCDQIRRTLTNAQNSDKPNFIACKTLIGKGTNQKEGSEKSHGAPLGLEEITHLKNNIDFDEKEFFVNAELKKSWEQAWERSQEEYDL